MPNLPVTQFLTARLTEWNANFELRTGTGFEQLFFQPMTFLIQPLLDEGQVIQTGQSFLRILNTGDPDSTAWNDSTDGLASNIFVTRQQGGLSSGSVRAFYDTPVDREYPANGAVFLSGTGNSYSNPDPFSITAAQMSSQLENGLYYFDITVESENTGADTEVAPGGIVSLVGDPNVITVTNIDAISGGINTETNTQLIARSQNSIGVRDLVALKGFSALFFENFPTQLAAVQPIGMGDIEMMRDVVYNTHIGGKVDGYVKTPALKQGSQDFVGILIDTTRQTNATANIAPIGTVPISVGNQNIDRTIQAPVVQQIAVSTPATYTSTVDMTTPLDLSAAQYAQLQIDGVVHTVRLAGVIPASTSRNELINRINIAFGQTVCSISGNTIKLTSQQPGAASEIAISTPGVGTSALLAVFGLADAGSPYIFNGAGPIVFVEGVHYQVDDVAGTITRIIGSVVVASRTTGAVSGTVMAPTTEFDDATSNIFADVAVNDILTILLGPLAGDYRVLAILDNNALVLDASFTTTVSSIHYEINRTGIKSGELVYVQYQYNPLSIDIGDQVVLDQYGRSRGIRPGRTDLNIPTTTNGAIVRINSIEEIDPITKEPTGTVLNGLGGYGRGGYGRGAYGIGNGPDYYLVVNIPENRFSIYEDSYIVLNAALQGLSFRVNFDYAPEVKAFHDFAIANRTLTGNVLMKHYLPAYVSGTITFTTSNANSNAPTVDELLAMVKAYIEKLPSTQDLDYSKVEQVITQAMDPNALFNTFIHAFALTTTIHNTDGSTTIVSGIDRNVIPTLDPFPSYTVKPLTPRITHWVADNIQLIQGS